MYNNETIESTVVKNIEYNQYTNVLLVKFQNDALYQYSFVPLSVYNRLYMAESKGRFIKKNMKAYPYKKLSTF